MERKHNAAVQVAIVREQIMTIIDQIMHACEGPEPASSSLVEAYCVLLLLLFLFWLFVCIHITSLRLKLCLT
ncbi:hypothetical protein ACE6H2_018581 [Prunus campanulata]